MRDSLTVLAILLIVLLTAALVAPYFIDWNSHRSLIEAKLSEAAGARVAIAGPIDVKLLPQPIFRLGRVTVGSTAPGQQGMTADEVDVEIALTALMRGEVQVVNATLRSPRLDLSAAANGALRLPVRAVADPERVRFQHMAVTNGTLTVADPGRGTLILSGINLEGEATSLLGPFKASGRFGPAFDPHPFHLSTGAFGGGKLRVKLALDGTNTRPAIDLDGNVVPGGAAPAEAAPAVRTKTSSVKPQPTKTAGPSFDGTMMVAGSVPLSASEAKVPWSLSGHVLADRDKTAVSELELRAGTEMRALIATGDGEAVFGAAPAAKLRLHGAQANLDALAVAPDGSSAAAPKGFDLLTRLSGLATDSPWLVGLPLRFDLDYGFDTATAGDLTIFEIGGHLRLDGRNVPQVRFAASGPENARVAFDGSFEPGSAPVFRGHLEAGLRDLPRFADRLGASLPNLAAWVKDTFTARTVNFAGTVDLSNVGIAARDLTLALDRTSLAGTLSYTRAVGADRARLFADLSSDALDLDALPDLGGWATHWGDLDLRLALAARAMKVAPAGIGAMDAGRIALRLDRTAGTVRLDEFSAELGSARISAVADLDAKAAHAQVHVEAPQLDVVADLLNHLLPGRPTALLKARSAALSPANLDFEVEASGTSSGALLPIALSVDGTANGTRISAQLKPDRPGDLDPANAEVSVGIAADGPEATTMLRQLGVPVAAVSASGSTFGPAIGAARLEVKAHGSMAAGFDTTLGATLGNASLSFSGKAKSGLGSGHLSLKGADLGRLLRAVGLVPAGGSGVWPAEADAELSWYDSNLAFRRLAGRLDGVAISGDLNTDVLPPASAQSSKPTLFGTLQLERLPASALFGLGLGASAPATGSALWSSGPFGPALLHLPRTEISMKIGTLGLRDALEARNASLILRAENGAVTLADLTGTLAAGGLGASGEGGRVGGTFTLRRDGPVASLSGVATWSNIALDLPGLAGRIGGTLDLAGTGNTAAALVASFAGSGSVTVAGGRIARFDPGAIIRTAAAAETNTSEVDADEVGGMLTAELDRGPLPLGDVTWQTSLATGVLRGGTVHLDGGNWVADTDASLDFRTMDFASKTTLRARQPLADWKSEKPQVTVSLKGPPAAPAREVDAAAFVNALQSRAIARDQERIDIIQQDIRERANFNRRLKAIEADQQAARDRAKAEADAARAQAEIDAQAQAEAARGKAQAEFEAMQAKAKADAEAARSKAKAAADARAATEIERQLYQDSLKPIEMPAPKSRAVPGAPAVPSPPPRPGLLPGGHVPAIGTGTTGIRAKPYNIRPVPPPSANQERSRSSGTAADPASEGQY